MNDNLLKLADLFLCASRESQLIQKYPQHAEAIKQLTLADPTTSKRYLNWMVAQLVKGHSTADIVPTVQGYHRKRRSFKYRDINQYKDLKEVEAELMALPESGQEKKRRTKADAKKLWENDDWILIHPETKDAVQKYGAATTWCITMSEENYYETYQMDGARYYFFLNKHPTTRMVRGNKVCAPDDKIAATYSKTAEGDAQVVQIVNAPQENAAQHDESYLHELGIPQEAIDIIHEDVKASPDSQLLLMAKGKLSEDQFREFWHMHDPESRQAIVSRVPEKYASSLIAMDPKLAAKHVRLTPEAFDALMALNDSDVKHEIISRLFYAHDRDMFVRKLLQDPDEDIRAAVISIQSNLIPRKLVGRLAKDPSPLVRKAVVNKLSQHLSDDALSTLASDPDETVRMTIAGTGPALRRLPYEGDEFLDDKSDLVRRELAGSEYTSPAMLASLVRDENESVRESVARQNRLIGSDNVERLAQDPSQKVRIYVAWRQDLNRAATDYLVNDEDSAVRRTLATHTKNPDVFLRLAHDPEASVRRGLAFNLSAKHIPAAALLEAINILYKDESPLVKKELIRNQHRLLTATQWNALVRDKDRSVRQYAAKYIPINKTGIQVADLLHDEYVVRGLSANNHVPETLELAMVEAADDPKVLFEQAKHVHGDKAQKRILDKIQRFHPLDANQVKDTFLRSNFTTSDVLAEIVRMYDLSPHDLEVAVNHPNRNGAVYEAVLAKSDERALPAILDSIAMDPLATPMALVEVLNRAPEHGNIGTTAYQRLIRHRALTEEDANQLQDPEIRNSVMVELAKTDGLSPEEIARFTEDKSDRVRYVTLSRPDVPRMLFQKHLNDTFHVRVSMAMNPICPEYVRAQLMRDPEVAKAAEYNPDWTWESVPKTKEQSQSEQDEELSRQRFRYYNLRAGTDPEEDYQEEEEEGWDPEMAAAAAHYQSIKVAKEKYTKEEKKRVDLDSRPPTLFTEYKNYDYTDADPDETSLGGGLYHGPMDKFKSVKEFIEHRRKKLKERKEKFATLAYSISKMAVALKFLVLDDDEDRHKGFSQILSQKGQVTHVHDYQEAVEALDRESFDEMFFDHDLSDFGEHPSGYGQTERTGADVAQYLARMVPQDRWPKLVHIHSWNPVGAHNIAMILDSAGIPYVREPYGDPATESVLWVQVPETGKWELHSELVEGDWDIVERHEQAGYKVKVLPFGEDPNEKG